MYLSFEGLLRIFYPENLHVVLYIKDILKAFVKNLKEEISLHIEDYFQVICLNNVSENFGVYRHPYKFINELYNTF